MSRQQPLYLLSLAVLGLALHGCSGEDAAPTPEVTTTKPPVEHVWQDQVETIDKARGVETIQEQQFQQQREAIDKQTQ